jgi:hypothetical protein
MTLCVSWGRSAPEGTNNDAAWGARAIFQRGFIDLLPDRQDVAGTRENVLTLNKWINSVGLKRLNKLVERLSGSSSEVVSFDDGPFHIEASPQSSYGYLYIGAWSVAQ